MSDCVFGLQGKDFVIVAADGTVEFSIVKFKETEDKIALVDDNKMIAAAGSQGERTQLMDLLQKNMHLYRLRNGVKLSARASASFARQQMAELLRSNTPYKVNMLLAGFDERENAASLYYIDYLAAMQKVTRGAHGYGAYFTLGLLDRYWKRDLSEEEAVAIVKMCIAEIRTRFLMDRNNFVVKIVNSTGVRVLDII
jgi:20S proteasome subunit beta 4